MQDLDVEFEHKVEHEELFKLNMHVIFGNVMHLTYVVFLKLNMCLKSIVHG
jgi:hypothetical protein